jgi:hypothetical protein
VARAARVCLYHGSVKVLASALSLVMLAAPVVLDACVLSCQASVHVSSGAAPSANCHHAAKDSTARVQAPRAPCGHNHGDHGVMVTPFAWSLRSVQLLQAVVQAPLGQASTVAGAGSSLVSRHDRAPAAVVSPVRPLRI